MTHTSRIIPDMEWFQQNIVWITGDAERYFKN